ncbi:MAG: hypothetical protein ABIW84_01490 [Ilumatobacteraceae bacterium]
MSMAIRIDLFACTSPSAFAATEISVLASLSAESPSAEGTDARWLGFVAADDADESELVALLLACANESVLVGAVNHGTGTGSTSAACCVAVAAPTPLMRTWLDVVSWCAEIASAGELQLAWLTRYDAAGSRDAGAEEWPTSWSDAPTEGSAADTPWPTA